MGEKEIMKEALDTINDLSRELNALLNLAIKLSTALDTNGTQLSALVQVFGYGLIGLLRHRVNLAREIIGITRDATSVLMAELMNAYRSGKLPHKSELEAAFLKELTKQMNAWESR